MIIFGSSVVAYLSDQVIVQLFGDGLRRVQTSGNLHRPLVQVLPVVVRGAERAASHGAEDGENTTHHRWATSHFHLRGKSARWGKKRYAIYIFKYVHDISRSGANQREIRCNDWKQDVPPLVPLFFLVIQLRCGRKERARNWWTRNVMLFRALLLSALRRGGRGYPRQITAALTSSWRPPFWYDVSSSTRGGAGGGWWGAWSREIQLKIPHCWSAEEGEAERGDGRTSRSRPQVVSITTSVSILATRRASTTARRRWGRINEGTSPFVRATRAESEEEM